MDKIAAWWISNWLAKSAAPDAYEEIKNERVG